MQVKNELDFSGFTASLSLFSPFQQVTGKLNSYDFTAGFFSLCSSPASYRQVKFSMKSQIFTLWLPGI